MTTQQHLITPPPELVEKWAISSPIQYSDESWAYELFIAHQAVYWGADQELEACKQVIVDQAWFAVPEHRLVELHNARRPKPPSLNEVALQMLSTIERDAHYLPEITDTIRRALEALDD